MRYLAILFAFFAVNALAQQQSTQFTVYFQSNAYEVEPAAKKSLDSLISLCEGAGFYQIELHAHTDLQGNANYNQALSLRRENSVEQYLVSKGLLKESIEGMAHGEELPEIEMEGVEDIRENRRVELKLTYQVFTRVDEVLQYTDIQAEQEFTFEDKGPQEVKGEKGTRLLVPSDAFQLADGTPVSNDQVEFVLQEFPGLGHGITHQLTTLSGGKILESGGMFRMEARFEGQELELRKGKEIKVQLPSDNVQKGMNVFVGQKDDKGDVVWEKTEKEFKALDTTEKAKLPLPGYGDRIRSYRVAFGEEPVYSKLDWDIAVPVKPYEPGIPREPSAPVAPKAPEGERPFMAGLFNSEWKTYKQQMQRYESAMRQYEKRLDSYEKSKERYDERYLKYQQDSTQYIQDSTNWVNTLNLMMEDRVALYVGFDAYYDAMRWNGALTSMARRMDDSTNYSGYLINDINRTAGYTIRNKQHQSLIQIAQEIELIAFLRSETFLNKTELAAYNGKLNSVLYYRNLKKKRIPNMKQMRNDERLVKSSQGNIYLANFNSDSLAKTDWRLMEGQIKDKKEALGIFDRSDVYNVYETSLDRMGYINCDRFADYAPEMMARIDVNVPPASKVFVVISRMNSLIPLYAGHDSTGVLQLPVGEEVKIVSIGTRDGRATYDYRRLKISKAGNHVELKPKPVSVETLKEQLSGL